MKVIEKVKQIKVVVYAPDWSHPDTNFYAWPSEEKILPLREELGAGAFKSIIRIPGRNEVFAKFRTDPNLKCEEANRIAEAQVSSTANYMISLCKLLSKEQVEVLMRDTCLPRAVCISSDGSFGLVLPLLPEKFKPDEEITFRCSHPRLVKTLPLCPFVNYLHIAFKTARLFSWFHRNRIIYGDISYNNVYVAPSSGSIYVIDLDGLRDYEATKLTATVTHSRDFAAPETLMSGCYDLNSEAYTLAIFLYAQLLHRHPLQPGRPWPANLEADEKENYFFGVDPIYADDPRNDGNRQLKFLLANYKIKTSDLPCPWVDPNVTSARRILGSELARLFERTFVDNLIEGVRPLAGEYACEIFRTINKLVPCESVLCRHAWMMPLEDGTEKCPICGKKAERYKRAYCYYRHGDVYRLKREDWVSVFDFKPLHEINFWAREDAAEFVVPDSPARLGYFHFEGDGVGCYYVAESAKRMVFGLIEEGGSVRWAYQTAAPGARTPNLQDRTLIALSENKGAALCLATEGDRLPETLHVDVDAEMGNFQDCERDHCHFPVSERWLSWRDPWVCHDGNWLEAGGIPFGRCRRELEGLTGKIYEEMRKHYTEDDFKDIPIDIPFEEMEKMIHERIVGDVGLISKGLGILDTSIQGDVSNWINILVHAFDETSKQWKDVNADIRSKMETAISRIEDAKNRKQ